MFIEITIDKRLVSSNKSPLLNENTLRLAISILPIIIPVDSENHSTDHGRGCGIYVDRNI